MNFNQNPILSDLNGVKIVLGVCGSIAAYKSAYLVRELCALGAHVRVVMTKGAMAFVQPMTFQALSGEAVHYDILSESAERAMGHIELARWADYLLIAPASADCIAKFAHGIADDLLSTLYLATTAPVILCAAMNQNMWAHPATVANCITLKERGVAFCGPELGAQACGDFGFGRMVESETVVAFLRLYAVHSVLQGSTILITAGPTQEAIDPVRYLSNYSSGKMGYALAQAAQIAGAQVILVSGPCALPPPFGVQLVCVRSAEQMLQAVKAHLKSKMIFIGAGAVADYRIESPKTKKLKRQDCEFMTLNLQKNPDILQYVVTTKLARLVIGFSAETHDVLRYAAEKLVNKKVDLLIANQVGEDLGFETDDNQITLLSTTEQTTLPRAPKLILAGQIILKVAQILKNDVRSGHESCYSN